MYNNGRFISILSFCHYGSLRESFVCQLNLLSTGTIVLAIIYFVYVSIILLSHLFRWICHKKFIRVDAGSSHCIHYYIYCQRKWPCHPLKIFFPLSSSSAQEFIKNVRTFVAQWTVSQKSHVMWIEHSYGRVVRKNCNPIAKKTFSCQCTLCISSHFDLLTLTQRIILFHRVLPSLCKIYNGFAQVPADVEIVTSTLFFNKLFHLQTPILSIIFLCTYFTLFSKLHEMGVKLCSSCCV